MSHIWIYDFFATCPSQYLLKFYFIIIFDLNVKTRYGMHTSRDAQILNVTYLEFVLNELFIIAATWPSHICFNFFLQS